MLRGALVIAAVAVPVAFASAAGASSSGSPATVSVRVEGLTKTLLVPTTVTTHTGSITKGGTPAGTCPATSAAGALDVATHHHWAGYYDTKYEDLEVIGILGESHSFTSKDYWEVFVDNVAAQAGICGLKLHKGEQLLFAAVPDNGPTEYPLGARVAESRDGRPVVHSQGRATTTPRASRSRWPARPSQPGRSTARPAPTGRSS